MAVTIARTAWTDDDGTGTSGTVINNAVKTGLYDQIDAALASLLPLAGGTLTGDLKFTDATYDIGKTGATRPRDGFFSRNVAVGGTLSVTGAADSSVRFSVNKAMTGTTDFGLQLRDTDAAAGTNTMADWVRAGTSVGSITTTLSTTAYNTSSDQRLKRDLGIATSVEVLRNTLVHDGEWLIDGSKDRFVFGQEAYLVKPTAVSVGTDERDAQGHLLCPWSVDYSKYVPDLIVGWQSHEARIAALEAMAA